ncbi:MAG: TIGR03792 family protein [Lacipirellulaceae bacterium]
MNQALNKFISLRVSLGLLAFLPVDEPALAQDSPKSVVEELTFQVEPDAVASFLQQDHRIWTATLSKQPGFLRKATWTSRKKQNNVRLIIHWRSQADWHSVPPSVLKETEEEFAAAMKNVGEYKLIGVNAWEEVSVRHHPRHLARVSDSVGEWHRQATNIVIEKDLSYGQRKRYRALPLKAAIASMFDLSSYDLATTKVVFHCKDDYQASMQLENALASAGWLALSDLEAPELSDWIPISKGGKEKFPGPSYVVWKEQLGSYQEYPWPYAILSIELVSEQDTKEADAIHSE